MEQKRLISHGISQEILENKVKKIESRIIQQGDKPYATIADQLHLLNQLQQFDFGLYLLQNQGLNGYWTHYMLTHPWFGRKTRVNNREVSLTDLEVFLLDKAPIMLATQQRFEIFLQENQKQVKNKAQLAAIPCGMLGELLYLNYDEIKEISLLGIDYDDGALADATLLATQKQLTPFLKTLQLDAWELKLEQQLDLISSNGLTIYEADNEKIIDLYRRFYQALKSNGTLVTSFLTYPPSLAEQCEWDLSKINEDHLMMQKIIFADIIEAKWQCYRSSEQTLQQLKEVGFEDIQFLYDDAKMFPTVVARKN